MPHHDLTQDGIGKEIHKGTSEELSHGVNCVLRIALSVRRDSFCHSCKTYPELAAALSEIEGMACTERCRSVEGYGGFFCHSRDACPERSRGERQFCSYAHVSYAFFPYGLCTFRIVFYDNYDNNITSIK